MSVVGDLIEFGLQFDRSWNNMRDRLYPKGNVPVQVADFFSNSSSLLKALVCRRYDLVLRIPRPDFGEAHDSYNKKEHQNVGCILTQVS